MSKPVPGGCSLEKNRGDNTEERGTGQRDLGLIEFGTKISVDPSAVRIISV